MEPEKRILVAVEDQGRLLPLLEALRGTPHRVVRVGFEAACRQIEQGEAVDLLIVDIEPPELSGFEVVRCYRRLLGKGQPVIALSDGFKREHIEGMLENVGVRRLFPADARPEELLFWVNNALFPETLRSRKAPRIPAAFSLSIAGARQSRRGRAFTLSEDGLFLETSLGADRGQVIELSFRLPGQSKREGMTAKCEVVWSNPEPRDGETGQPPYGLGLRFLDLDESSRRAIKTFVLQSLIEQTI